jgi:hypothetical protein
MHPLRVPLQRRHRRRPTHPQKYRQCPKCQPRPRPRRAQRDHCHRRRCRINAMQSRTRRRAPTTRCACGTHLDGGACPSQRRWRQLCQRPLQLPPPLRQHCSLPPAQLLNRQRRPLLIQAWCAIATVTKQTAPTTRCASGTVWRSGVRPWAHQLPRPLKHPHHLHPLHSQRHRCHSLRLQAPRLPLLPPTCATRSAVTR